MKINPEDIRVGNKVQVIKTTALGKRKSRRIGEVVEIVKGCVLPYKVRFKDGTEDFYVANELHQDTKMRFGKNYFTKRHSKVRLSNMNSSDCVRLIAKKDTIVARQIRGKEKQVKKTIREQNAIEGQIAFCLPDGIHAWVFITNDIVPCDYWAVKIEDFNWEIYVPVNTRK